MNTKVGVLGCGWLGFPLALAMMEKDYTVRGATRSEKQWERIGQSAVSPFLVEAKEDEVIGALDFFKGLDVLIISLPPGIRKNPKRNFIKVINTLIETVCSEAIHRVIFISSTAVYGNQNGPITEDIAAQPITESGKQLLECEKRLLSAPGFNTLILRFGGLIGAGRHPVYNVSAKKSIPNPEGLINFIHLNDCIGMIQRVLSTSITTGVYNGVSPYHPTRKEYYTEMAKRAEITLPSFSKTSPLIREVSPQKFQNDFNYTFLVENLLTLK